MLSFLKYVFATIVGLIFFSVIMIFILLGIGAVASSSDTFEPEKNSVLHLRLRQPIIERGVDNPLEAMGVPNNLSKSGMGLVELKKVIRNAGQSPEINGILLDLREIMAGMATLEEIRNVLIEFKSTGKFIYAYGETYSESAYYLASVADNIYLHPMGSIEFNGFNYEMLFFAGTFDKLDIEPQVFRVGKYKSAVEPFTRKSMSDENEQQINALITSLYSTHIDKISKSRKISKEKLRKVSDSMLVRTVDDAINYNLADGICYRDVLTDTLKAKSGLGQDDKLSLVSYRDFRNAENKLEKSSSENQVAVILASGEIRRGEGEGQDVIGAAKIAEEIRKARNNDDIKAVVLRINSPGGSAIASDIMWREVVLTTEKKPVIASMSDVAASGGYYMAMGCDTIVAQPNTITGSIGVFGLIFNLRDFLDNKLGVTVDNVKTGVFSNIENSTRPLSEAEKKIIHKDMKRIYKAFVTKAANGRGMPEDSVRSLASGRVWTGVQARKNGLVDKLGSLEDAIRIASEKAGIAASYQTKYYPSKKGFLEKLMRDFQLYAQIKLNLKPDLGRLTPYQQALEKLPHMQGVQARVPYQLKID